MCCSEMLFLVYGSMVFSCILANVEIMFLFDFRVGMLLANVYMRDMLLVLDELKRSKVF